MMTLFGYLEPAAFILGIGLVLIALFKYTQRTKDYGSVWRVMVNKLKDGFTIDEFKYYRLGVVILIFGLVVRLVNQIFFPSYW
tara:strand:+ start:288 stop:536 length:249 start_codon:yes stop_codon:yes gene_type:complete